MCNDIAQMLLSMMSGIDVVMPSGCILLLSWMTVCLYMAMMLLAITGMLFVFFLFHLKFWMLNSMLSQMCGRFVFPNIPV